MKLKWKIGLLLTLSLVNTLGCSSQQTPDLGFNTSAKDVDIGSKQSTSPEPWVTPLPWTELRRISNPDHQVDAVLVTKKDTGPPLFLPADPTDLYLVPSGEEVPTEPPYPPYPSKLDPIEKVRAKTPFHGYDVKKAQLKWQDANTLLLGAKAGDIRQREESHTVFIAQKKRLVKIIYFIEWDSMAEIAGPIFPKN